MKTLQNEMRAMAEQASSASRSLALLKSDQKRAILFAMAEELERQTEAIKVANAKDMQGGKNDGLTGSMLDRLHLTDTRIASMIAGVRQIADLADPVGEVLKETARPNKLRIRKVRVPIGVITIIYESRPNVTADAAALCIKTSNAVILRGGKEAIRSNLAIAAALQSGGEKAGLPPSSVQLVPVTDRETVKVLLQMDDLIDLVIPRGGESLIRAVAEMSRIPVIKHYKGVCHTYVDETADLEMALAISENAKCQRPGVCNAMETLLVHSKVAPEFLPKMAKLLGAAGVELRGDEAARSLVPAMKPAVEDDWYAEYLDLILAVRVVPDLTAAIDHIEKYGSHHSDCIVTDSEASAARFTGEVDSATVYVNASTRFTDGAEFGMGAEMGISTDKIHARGPMGLEELTTYKYVILGEGQVRP